MTRLTEKDADILAAMMILGIAMADRAADLLVKYHADAYITCKEYKELASNVGKKEAQKVIKDACKKVFDGNKSMYYGEWKRVAEDFSAKTLRILERGRKTESLHDESITYMDMHDAQMRDSQLLGRIFLYLGNIKVEDYIKVESTLKLMAKEDNVPSYLATEYFTPR